MSSGGRAGVVRLEPLCLLGVGVTCGACGLEREETTETEDTGAAVGPEICCWKLGWGGGGGLFDLDTGTFRFCILSVLITLNTLLTETESDGRVR